MTKLNWEKAKQRDRGVEHPDKRKSGFKLSYPAYCHGCQKHMEAGTLARQVNGKTKTYYVHANLCP